MTKKQKMSHEVFCDRGVACMGRGEYGNAKGFFMQALQQAPDNPRYHEYCAAACIQLKQFSNAIDSGDRALKNAPTSAAAWKYIVEGYMGLNERGLAAWACASGLNCGSATHSEFFRNTLLKLDRQSGAQPGPPSTEVDDQGELQKLKQTNASQITKISSLKATLPETRRRLDAALRPSGNAPSSDKLKQELKKSDQQQALLQQRVDQHDERVQNLQNHNRSLVADKEKMLAEIQSMDAENAVLKSRLAEALKQAYKGCKAEQQRAALAVQVNEQKAILLNLKDDLSLYLRERNQILRALHVAETEICALQAQLSMAPKPNPPCEQSQQSTAGSITDETQLTGKPIVSDNQEVLQKSSTLIPAHAILLTDAVTPAEPVTLAEQYNARAAKLFSLGNYSDAVVELDKAIANLPDNAVLYANRCGARFALDEYELAVEDATTCTRLAPGYSRGWYLKGLCHNILRQQEQARKALEQEGETCRLQCRHKRKRIPSTNMKPS